MRNLLPYTEELLTNLSMKLVGGGGEGEEGEGEQGGGGK